MVNRELSRTYINDYKWGPVRSLPFVMQYRGMERISLGILEGCVFFWYFGGVRNNFGYFGGGTEFILLQPPILHCKRHTPYRLSFLIIYTSHMETFSACTNLTRLHYTTRFGIRNHFIRK